MVEPRSSEKELHDFLLCAAMAANAEAVRVQTFDQRHHSLRGLFRRSMHVLRCALLSNNLCFNEGYVWSFHAGGECAMHAGDEEVLHLFIEAVRTSAEGGSATSACY